jgi:hypothetical protein
MMVTTVHCAEHQYMISHMVYRPRIAAKAAVLVVTFLYLDIRIMMHDLRLAPDVYSDLLFSKI